MRYEMFNDLILELHAITTAITKLQVGVVQTNIKLDHIIKKMDSPCKTPEYDERGFEITDD